MITKYVFYNYFDMNGSTEIFDTAADAMTVAVRDWNALGWRKRDKYLTNRESCFTVCRVKISEADFQKYEAGELESHILDYDGADLYLIKDFIEDYQNKKIEDFEDTGIY